VNLNDRSTVTQLQVTIFVFRLNYAFHLIAEGLTVCIFSVGFCMSYRFAVTKLLSHVPYFRNFDDVTNTVARCFHHLVPSENFHCDTPLKNAKFDLFGSKNTSWQIWMRIEIG